MAGPGDRLDRIEVYPRSDSRWAWRRVAPNGNIVATDGSQGYENLTFAITAAIRACETTVGGIDRFDHDPRAEKATAPEEWR